jgi:hemoglobin-like flavoprotein
VELFGPVQLRTLPRTAETQSAAGKKHKQGRQNRRKFQQRKLALDLHMYVFCIVSTRQLPAMLKPVAEQHRGTDAAPSYELPPI